MLRICLLLLLSVLSCTQDPLETLISPDLTKGSLQNLKVDYKLSSNKSVTGGMAIHTTAAVPYDINRDQIRPTLLAGIKAIKQKHPECEWINLFLCPEKESAGLALYCGRAEYKEGEIGIWYGVPNAVQLVESAEDAEASRDPALKGKADDWGIPLYDSFKFIQCLRRQQRPSASC
jgi:hypothetical protein